MSAALWKVVIGGLWMELRESRGPRYTLVFGLVSDRSAVCITYLGDDQPRAMDIFARKVRYHRAVMGS